MKKRMKIISMILVIGLVFGNLNIIRADAIQVNTEKKESPKVRIVFLNDYIDETIKETVFTIKNRTDSSIIIKKVEFQTVQNGEWVSVEKKRGAVTARNIKIDKGKNAYDSIVLRENYVLPEKTLESGKYGVCVTYKYEGEYFQVRKTFEIEKEDETIVPEEPDEGNEGNEGNDAPGMAPPSDENDHVTLPAPPSNPTVTPETDVNKPIAKPNVGTSNVVLNNSTVIENATVTGDADECMVLNSDFSIGKKGKCRAMVFTEAYFLKTDKVKIQLKIQRKTKGKWKKVKKYKVTKKSNVAFINKKLKIKKSGTYRMNVEVTFYKKGKKQGSYTIKSKSRKFKRK